MSVFQSISGGCLREREREREKGDDRGEKNIQTTPTCTYCKHTRHLSYSNPNYLNAPALMFPSFITPRPDHSDAEETIAVLSLGSLMRKQAAAVRLPYGFTSAVVSTILLRWPTLISVAQRSAHCRHSTL